jgi:hypothetical protein
MSAPSLLTVVFTRWRGSLSFTVADAIGVDDRVCHAGTLRHAKTT